jgi:hypothetical protein
MMTKCSITKHRQATLLRVATQVIEIEKVKGYFVCYFYSGRQPAAEAPHDRSIISGCFLKSDMIYSISSTQWKLRNRTRTVNVTRSHVVSQYPRAVRGRLPLRDTGYFFLAFPTRRFGDYFRRRRTFNRSHLSPAKFRSPHTPRAHRRETRQTNEGPETKEQGSKKQQRMRARTSLIAASAAETTSPTNCTSRRSANARIRSPD